jgi:aspartyl protease family protein
MKTSQQTFAAAKYFVWIAWFIAFALLVFVFQEVLEHQWNPNTQPKSTLNSNGKAEVRLNQNKQGHYLTTGTINGNEVTFLLDTGATNVSIPLAIANRLGLEKYGAHIAQTANGPVKVYQTVLNRLSIGDIYLFNVDASINPGMRSNEILLGMSALKQVEFSQSGKQLTLREQ